MKKSGVSQAPTTGAFSALISGFILPAVSGILLTLSFAPWHKWLLAYVGISVLVYSLRGASYAGSAWRGFLAGMAFFLPLTEWSRESTGTFIAHIALSTALSLYILAACVVWQFLMRRIRSVWLLAPALGIVWVACEQLRSSWPYGGMPWGSLAFGQVDGPLLFLAPYGSTQAVALVCVISGVLIEETFSLSRTMLSRFSLALVAVGLVLFPVVLPTGSSADSYLTIAFVQGNVPRDNTSGAERALKVTRNLVKETEKIYDAGAQLVLWPESASDIAPEENEEVRSLIQNTVDRLGVPLLLGTQHYPGNIRYNDYTLWQPGQGKVALYSKQHPVPFGEYVPNRDFFRRFTPAVDQVGRDMKAGEAPALLDVATGERSVSIATPICFEIAYTNIVTEAVAGGAQLIVVPTNNASFGDSHEALQQFDMTRFRAVETNRTAIQVSTMGVSGVVESNGVVHNMTGLWTSEHRVVKVPLNSKQTLATRFSKQIYYGFAIASGAVVALALVGSMFTRKKQR